MTPVGKLIWAKSPLKILLFLILLLAGLGHFEYQAAQLQDRALYIQISSAAEPIASAPNRTEEDLLYYENFSAEIQGWMDRLDSTSTEVLQERWNSWKQKHPEKSRTKEAELFGAVLRIRAQDYSGAEEVLQQVQEQYGSAEDIYFYKGVLNSARGDKLAAISNYQKALRNRPLFFEAAFNLGVLNYNLKRYPEARDYLKQATRLSSGSRKAAAFRVLGKSLLELGEYREAQDALEESILLEPAAIDARLALADLLGNYLNEPEAGRKIYQKILSLEEQSPEAYIGLAQLESNEGDPRQAIQVLSDALPLVPETDELRLELAKIYIDLNRYDLALTQVNLVLEAKSNNYNALFQRGRVNYQRRKYAAAEKDFKEAIEASHESQSVPFLEAFNNLGLTFMAGERWNDAIDVLKQTVERAPWYKTAYYNLGIAYLNDEQLVTAREAFDKALAIDDEYQQAWYNLGVVESRLGNLNSAVDAYRKALRIDPKDVKSRLNLAVQLKKSGYESQALEQYRLVLEIRPNYASAWFNLALLYKNEGDYEQAEDAYRRAIDLEPEQAVYSQNLSALLADMNKTDEAIEVLQKGLEFHPEAYILRFNLALQYEDKGELQRALDEYRTVVELESGYVRGWENLGDIQAKLDLHDEAVTAYRRTLELEDKPYTHYELGKQLYKLDRFNDAVTHFELSLSEIRDNGFIWYNAGKAYQALDKTEKAQEYYTKALRIDPDLTGYIDNRLALIDESDQIFRSKMAAEPDNPVWPKQLAEILHQQGRTEEAVSVLVEAAKRFESNGDILISLARKYAELEQWRQAESYFQEALRVEPDNPELVYEMAKTYEQQERWEAAEVQLKRAVARMEDPLPALKDLGEVYYEQKNYAEAISVLKKVTDAEPDHGPSWIDLGKAYYREERYQEALDSFSKANGLMPTYPWAYVWLGRSHRKLGEYDQAEALYMQALGLEEDFVQGYVALGDLYREQILDSQAAGAYEKALALDPLDNSIRRRLESVRD